MLPARIPLLRGTRRAYEGARIDALSASAHALAEASLRQDLAPFRPFTKFAACPEDEQQELLAAGQRLTEVYLEAGRQGIAENSIRDVNAKAVLATLPGMVEWLPKWFDAFNEAEHTRALRLDGPVARGYSGCRGYL